MASSQFPESFNPNAGTELTRITNLVHFYKNAEEISEADARIAKWPAKIVTAEKAASDRVVKWYCRGFLATGVGITLIATYVFPGVSSSAFFWFLLVALSVVVATKLAKAARQREDVKLDELRATAAKSTAELKASTHQRRCWHQHMASIVNGYQLPSEYRSSSAAMEMRQMIAQGEADTINSAQHLKRARDVNISLRFTNDQLRQQNEKLTEQRNYAAAESAVYMSEFVNQVWKTSDERRTAEQLRDQIRTKGGTPFH